MAQTFIHKPVPVHAMQLRWDTWKEMTVFCNIVKTGDGNIVGCYIGEDGRPTKAGTTSGEIGMLIPVPNGVMVARQNDWIVKSEDGNIIALKQKEFERLYELKESGNE